MTDAYEQYEKECQRIQSENENLLEEFADWLSSKGLAETTIRGHCRNMAFYIEDVWGI